MSKPDILGKRLQNDVPDLNCEMCLFGDSFPASPLKLTVPDMYDAYDCKNETAAESTIKATAKNMSV